MNPEEYLSYFIRYDMDVNEASNVFRIKNEDEAVANKAIQLLQDYRGANVKPQENQTFSPTVENIIAELPNAYETAKQDGMNRALVENKIVPEQFMTENPDFDVLHVVKATNPEYLEQRKKAETATYAESLPGVGPMGAFTPSFSEEESGALDFLQFGSQNTSTVLTEDQRNQYLDYLDDRAAKSFESKYILPLINEKINGMIPEDFVSNKDSVGELERGLRERMLDEGLGFGLDIDNDGKIGLKSDDSDNTSTWVGKAVSELGIGLGELTNTALEFFTDVDSDDFDEEDITFFNSLSNRNIRKEMAKRWRNTYVTNAKSLEHINAKVESEGMSMESFQDYFGVMGDLFASSAVPLMEMGLAYAATKKVGKKGWNKMSKSDKKIVRNHVGTAQLTTAGAMSTALQMAHVRESVVDQEWYQNLDPMQRFSYTSVQAVGEILPALVGASLLKRGAKKLKNINYEKSAENSYLKMTGKVVATTLSTLGRGFTEEAITEGVTAAIQYYNDYKYRSLGGDKNATFDPEEMVNSVLSAASAGGIMGLVFSGVGAVKGAVSGGYSGYLEVKDSKKMNSDPVYRKMRENAETIASDTSIKDARVEIDEIAKQFQNSRNPQERAELARRMEDVATNMGVRHSSIIKAYDRVRKENPALAEKLFNVNTYINNLISRYKAIPIEDSPAKIGLEKQLYDAIKRRSELETEGQVQEKVSEEINNEIARRAAKTNGFKIKQGYAPQSMTIDAQVDASIREAEVQKALNSMASGTKEQMDEMYTTMRNTFNLPAEKAYHAASVANRMIGIIAQRAGIPYEAARALIQFRKGDKNIEASLKSGSKALFQNNYIDSRTGVRFEYDKNQERFKRLSDEGRITDGEKSLSDWEGEIMFVHGPDDAGAMSIYDGTDLIYEGKGGAYYPMKFESMGAFWASRGKSETQKTVKSLNEAARKTPSGNGLMALMTGGTEKILNSHLGYRAATSILKSLADKGGFGITRTAMKIAMLKTLEKTGDANGVDAESSYEAIEKKFYEAYDDISFNDRKKMYHDSNSFLSFLAEEIKNAPEKNHLALREFLRNKFSTDPNTSTVSKTYLRDGLAYMIAEPHVRDLYRSNDGQVAYAVIEAVRPDGMAKDEDIFEAVESDSHESYPYMIRVKPGVTTRIHFLNDASPYQDSFVNPESGNQYAAAKKQGDKAKAMFGGQIQGSIGGMRVQTKHSKKGEIEWQETPRQSMKGDTAISSRNSVVSQAAKDLLNGEISTKDYLRIVDENTPIQPINTFFKAVGEDHAAEALGKKSDKMMQELVDSEGNPLSRVGLRLDIPAYMNNNAWVVSVHDGKTESGKVVSYMPAARIRNVEFVSNSRAAINVAAGKSKSTFARMMGDIVDIEGDTWEEIGRNAEVMIEEIVDSPQWTQVGMNPFKHSFFWDRMTKSPVVAAEEVIQVGGNVYAKNVTYAKATDDRFMVRDPKGEPELDENGKPTGKKSPLLGKDGKPVYFQDSKGAMVAEDSGYTIWALTDPDVSTPLHELAHVFEHYLTTKERAEVMAWARHSEWNRDTSEAFARGFEKFLYEKASDVTLQPGMKKMFNNFRKWLLDIYEGVTGSAIDIELNAKMRTLYGKMIEPTKEEERRNFKKKRNEVAQDPEANSQDMLMRQEEKGAFTLMMNALDRLFADRYRDVKEMLSKYDSNLARALRFETREQLFYGRAATRLEDAKAQIFDPFHEKRREYGVSLDELSEYLYALHSNERNALIYERSQGKVTNGSGMSSAEAQQIIQRYSGQKAAQMRELAEDVYQMMSNIRSLQVEYELETADTVAAYENMYRNFVPLRGFADARYEEMTDAGVKLPSGSGLSVKGSGNLIAKGRKSKAANILLQVERMHAMTVMAGERNMILRPLYDLVQENPDGSIWEFYTKEGALPDSLRSRAVEIRVEGRKVNIIFAEQRHADTLNNATGRKLQPFMNFLNKVKFRQYNNFLRQSFTNKNPAFIIINYLRDMSAVLFNASAESSIPDGYAIKDFKYRIVTQSPLYIKGLYRIARGKPVDPELKQYFEEYRQSGGRTGWAYMQTIEELAKSLETKDNEGRLKAVANKAYDVTLGAVEDMNGAVEDSFRVAAFVEARKAGQDIASAALLAKNISVNFNQSGELGPLMNTLYLFFGSSVQGTKRFARSMFTLKSTKKPAGILDAWHNNLNGAQKMALFSINLGTMMTMMNYAMSEEDEDGILFYDKISDVDKERNIVIMKPDGRGHYKIPLPYGYNIFHQIGVVISELAHGSRTSGNATLYLANAATNSFVPISFGQIESGTDLARSFLPTASRPFGDVAVNRTYYNTPVYQKKGEFNKDIPDSELSFRGPDWWRNVFKFFNKMSGGSEDRSGSFDLNPDGLSYIISFYIGGVGRFISRSGNLISNISDSNLQTRGLYMAPNDVPIARNFMGEASKYYDFDRYEERSIAVDQLYNEIKNGNIDEDKSRYKGIIRLKDLNKEVRKTRRKIWEMKNKANDIEDYAKRQEMLFALNEKERILIAKFNRIYDDVRED